MINIEQVQKMLKISYIDSEGQVKIKEINIPEEELFEWKYTKSKNCDSKIRSWDDKPVKKFPAPYLNKYRITEFLHNLPQNIQNEIFQFNNPKMYFCDIEVEVLDEFPDINNPIAEVQTIAIANEKEQIIVLGTQKITKDDIQSLNQQLNKYFNKFKNNITFKYVYYEDEFSMLYSFFDKFVKNMTLITGWNFVDFDWDYLIARSKSLSINPAICSPSMKLFDKHNFPLHKIVIDYMDVYKRWDRVVKTKESNGLDYVSKVALGIQKIKYSGNLIDLYRNNYIKFIFYNTVDAFLVRLLHEKLNTVMPFLKLSHITRVEILKAYGSVHLVENVICRELLKQNKVLIKPNFFGKNQSRYEGAYVMEPVVGFHKYLATFDYSSLYPTCIRQWNISPETFIGKIQDEKIKEIYEKETENYILSSSGAVFLKNKEGVLKELLSKLFIERKKAKNKGLDIKNEINILKKYL